MDINLKTKRLFIKHEVSERKSYFKQYFVITMETVMNKCFLFFRYCTVHVFLKGGHTWVKTRALLVKHSLDAILVSHIVQI